MPKMTEKLAFLGVGYKKQTANEYANQMASAERWPWASTIAISGAAGASAGSILGALTGIVSGSTARNMIPGATAGLAFGVALGSLIKAQRDREIDIARKFIHSSNIDERVKDELVANLDQK